MTTSRLRATARRLWKVRTARTGFWLAAADVHRLHVCWPRARGDPEAAVQDVQQEASFPSFSTSGRADPNQLGSIVGADLPVSKDLDLTHGVAITSSIHPTSDTQVAPCDTGKGFSNRWASADVDDRRAGPQGTDVPGGGSSSATRPGSRGTLRMLTSAHWSERTVIAW